MHNIIVNGNNNSKIVELIWEKMSAIGLKGKVDVNAVPLTTESCNEKPEYTPYIKVEIAPKHNSEHDKDWRLIKQALKQLRVGLPVRKSTLDEFISKEEMS